MFASALMGERRRKKKEEEKEEGREIEAETDGEVDRDCAWG